MDHARADADAAMPLLARALAYEGSLRSRTEGLTWAVWGIVLALVFLMYAAMGDVGGVPPAWVSLLWVPWVLAGALFTWALWRTAALDPFTDGARPAGLLVTLAWVGAIVAGLAVTSLAPMEARREGLPLVAVGLAWLLMGGANLFRATPRGRRSVLAIGAATVAAGLALLLLPPPDWGAPGADTVRFGQDLLRAAVAAGVPLAVGLRQALRG